ncbi:MAG: DUF3572 domain-containing protein [Pseudomonadota bacterium]
MTPSTQQALPRARAEAIALQALGWLAGDEDRIGALLNLAGMSPDDLRARASDPEFLGFVLDHLLQDEPALLAFCEEASIVPDEPMRARAALPGGDLPHWT